MTPTLADGEFVLVDPDARVDVGDLVLAVHPDEADRLIVKRLTERLVDGRVMLMSDNPAGSDSRSWGPLEAAALRGRVTLILDRPFGSTDPGVARPGRRRSARSRQRRTDRLRWLRR